MNTDFSKFLEAQLPILDRDTQFALESIQMAFVAARPHLLAFGEALLFVANNVGKIVSCLAAETADVQQAAAELLIYMVIDEENGVNRVRAIVLWQIEFCRPDVTQVLVAALVQSTNALDWDLMMPIAVLIEQFLSAHSNFQDNPAIFESWRGGDAHKTAIAMSARGSSTWHAPGQDGVDEHFVSLAEELPSFYFQVAFQQHGAVEALMRALHAFTMCVNPALSAFKSFRAVAAALKHLFAFVNVSYYGADGQPLKRVQQYQGELPELLQRSLRGLVGALPTLVQLGVNPLHSVHTLFEEDDRGLVLDVLLALFPLQPVLLPREVLALDTMDTGYVDLVMAWLSSAPHSTNEQKMIKLLRCLAVYSDSANKAIGKACIRQLVSRIPDLRTVRDNGKLALYFQEGHTLPTRDLYATLLLLLQLAPKNLDEMRTHKVHLRLVTVLTMQGARDWDDVGDHLLLALLQDDEMRNGVAVHGSCKKVLIKYARDTARPIQSYDPWPILKRLCGHGRAWAMVASNFTVNLTHPRTEDPSVPLVPKIVNTPTSGDWVGERIEKVDFDAIAKKVLGDERVLRSAAVDNPSPNLKAALLLLTLMNDDLNKDADLPPFTDAHVFTPAELQEAKRRAEWPDVTAKIRQLYGTNALWHATVSNACDRVERLLGAPNDNNLLYAVDAREAQDGLGMFKRARLLTTKLSVDLSGTTRALYVHLLSS